MAEPRAETRFAKQLFLFGNGNGQPVRNVDKLSKLSGVHEQTIRKYLSEWEKEAQELLASSSECGLAISLNRKQIDQNNKDIDFIRDQLNKITFEIKSLEKIALRLAEWMDKFDGDDIQTALSIFSDWQRATGSEAALRSQFIALKKLWDEKAAIDGLRDIALTREKEITKGKARIELKKLENEKPPETARIAGGLFARRDRIEILEE